MVSMISSLDPGFDTGCLDSTPFKKMQIRRKALSILLSLVPAFAHANFFQTQEVKTGARLRHLALRDVVAGGGEEVVVMERSGEFPNYRSSLSIYGTPSGQKLEKVAEMTFPTDSLLYGFFNHALILIRGHSVEKWTLLSGVYKPDPLYRATFDSFFEIPETGDVTYIPVQSPINPNQILVPGRKGLLVLESTAKGWASKGEIPAPVRAFYTSSSEKLPFDPDFLMRGSLWYPHVGSGKMSSSLELSWIFSWMDEVTTVSTSDPKKMNYFKLGLLSEKDRDDEQAYVETSAEDLNKDGHIDFVANKFRGSATSLQAETTLFYTKADGMIDIANAKKIEPTANRTGGALVSDFNKDGWKDLVVASTQYNAWAIIRALLRKQVNVNFSFYMGSSAGFRLNAPDFTKEVSFQFDLNDGQIDGLLPSLDGDFNGDGYADVFFARNPRAVTLLIQQPKEKEFYSVSLGRNYEVDVLRKYRIGDLNGDGKSDVVMYDSRSAKNRQFTVLLNSGALR
jgi:hypothetical protein